jgi:hypothetical protein
MRTRRVTAGLLGAVFAIFRGFAVFDSRWYALAASS